MFATITILVKKITLTGHNFTVMKLKYTILIPYNFGAQQERNLIIF